MPVALALAFLVVPVAEIALILAVGRSIGAWPTVLLLLAQSAFGAWLIRREGGRAWRALRAALGTGRMPGRELADAALVLIGGTLLLTPGFLTDVVGYLFVLPATRPLARRALAAAVARRARRAAGRAASGAPRTSRASGAPRASRRQGIVIIEHEGAPAQPGEPRPGEPR